MISVGLLISLESSEACDGLAERLSAKGTVFPGAAEGRWLPVAAEAETDEALRELHDWIAGLPGVAFVDVVHVNFEDSSMIDSTLLSAL